MQELEALAAEERWAVSPGDVSRAFTPTLFLPPAGRGAPAGVPPATQDEARPGEVLLSWRAFLGTVLAALT